jgi:NAD-dependent dihydropyrimidine dehydrogenase PreA subunit
MMVIGGFFLWVLNKPMTWARASIAATLTWMELVIIFGIVPSEWLNLSQTDLDWSPQNIALTFPPGWCSATTSTSASPPSRTPSRPATTPALLVAAPVFAIMIQKMKDGRPAPAATEEPKSPYGRTLRRVTADARGVVDETPPFRDDYQLALVEGDYFTDKLRPKQFLHIDQAECILCEGCVDICPWKCIHYLSVDAITEAVNVDNPG